jgi:hypothetical protein
VQDCTVFKGMRSPRTVRDADVAISVEVCSFSSSIDNRSSTNFMQIHPSNSYPKPRFKCLGNTNSSSCMNDLAQFQPAFNGVNTLLAVSTNIETEQITNGNL